MQRKNATTHRNAGKQAEALYDTARQLLMDEVIATARQIMTDHPKLQEFLIAMGDWFFIGKDDQNYDDRKLHYLKPFADFIGKWDDIFRLTGEGIRFTKDGEIVTKW